jgi:deoxyribodipyrimidine photo-lyase
MTQRRPERAPTRTAVVLFTRDLRVHDHPGLARAAQTSRYVVPLFVVDERILGSLVASPNRIAFLLEALADLRESLRRLGADLVVRRGDPVVEALRVSRSVGATVIYASEDASGYAQARQRHLAHECSRHGVELRALDAIAVVPPGTLAPQGSDHYRVFTPFWRRWCELPLQPAVPSPVRVELPAGLDPGPLPSLRDLTGCRSSPSLPRGGEQEGRRRLQRWLAEGLSDYERQRDELAADATSRLSPYLHFGCLSAREVVADVRAHGRSESFLRQLCWRDFFGQLLAANPRAQHVELHDRGDAWRQDEDALARWREGATGYPIVDAAMRQLAGEGWIANRARMIAASFLTKTLYLDWRHGQRVFSELLVDGDIASNAGNWQWVAGTGADTRPNRVLNPLAQARRFDREGAYVRRYVPEVARLPGASAHEPWRAQTSLVAPEYPEPIVDHAAASERFRARRRSSRPDAAA